MGTQPKRAEIAELHRIVTPLRAEAWEKAIKGLGLESVFGDIPLGIRDGFRMRTTDTHLSHTRIFRNHQSATSHPDTIAKHLIKELKAGRYCGPFNPSDLEHVMGPFCASPLGLIPKSGNDDFRIIQDFSFPANDPYNPSVNSEINSDDFPCEWGSFSDMYKIVAEAPEGAEGATFDVDSAFRNIPVHPSDRPHIVVVWNDLAYVDGNIPFGAASSGGVWGHVADGLRSILVVRGIAPAKNWVDDFAILQFPAPGSNPPLFTYNEETIYEVGTELGVPWKKSKTRPFAPRFRYLGFDWDIPNRTVEIPQEKKEKYSKKVETILTKGRISRKETENLLGTLNHCALAMDSGRARLPSIANLAASFNSLNNPFASVKIPARALDDLQWWATELQRHFCGSSVRNPPPVVDMDFWVDASTSFGIGVIWSGHWDSWRLVDGWKSHGRDIGWAEMVAVELGLRTMIAGGMRKTNIILKSDNAGVIGALQAKKSRSYQQNTVLRRIIALLMEHDIWITSEYVESKNNLADLPSRGIAPPERRHMSWFHLTPPELSSFLSRTQIP